VRSESSLTDHPYSNARVRKLAAKIGAKRRKLRRKTDADVEEHLMPFSVELPFATERRGGIGEHASREPILI